MNYVLIDFTHGNLCNLMEAEPTIEALYYKHAPCQLDLVIDEDSALHLLGKHPLISKIHKSLQSIKVEDLSRGILYDFNTIKSYNGAASLVDAFAVHANTNLLRRTPSLGNYKPARGKHRVIIDITKSVISKEELYHISYFDPHSSENAGMSEEEALEVLTGAEVVISDNLVLLQIAHSLGIRSIVGIYSTKEVALTRSHPGIRWVLHSDPKEVIMKAINLAVDEVQYPGYLNVGDAGSWVKGLAHMHCRGYGLDVGSSRWPLFGALSCTEVDRDEKFAKGPFDFIYSSHCLEHIVEWEKEIKYWDAHVLPGGTLFLYLPHPNMKYWEPGGEWVGDNHVWAPSPVSLVKWLMENTSFKVEEYTCYPDAAWSFYIRAKKRTG